MKKVVPVDGAKTWPSIRACSDLSLVGETTIGKGKNVGPPPRVTLPSKRVTLRPGLPCPPSQLCDFSCKRFAAIYKEMYEKLSRPGWLGMEGDPLTRDNFSPYKQALIGLLGGIKFGLIRTNSSLKYLSTLVTEVVYLPIIF